MTERTHAEAPASATARMTSPGGVQWLLTLRDDTANGLLDKIGKLEPYLLEHGWTPDAQRSANGNGGDRTLCPVHQKPMKESKFGGLYCPAKNDDGTYCKEKVV